jgi:hypothetical protein
LTEIAAARQVAANRQVTPVDRGRFILDLRTGQLSAKGSVFSEESPREADELRAVGYYQRWGKANVFFNYDFDSEVARTIVQSPEDHTWKLFTHEAGHAPPFTMQ